MTEVKISLVKALPQSDFKPKVHKDILPTLGRPCDEVDNYSSFYDELLSSFKEDCENEELDQKSQDKKVTDFIACLNEVIISEGTIYMTIGYPVTIEPIFKYTVYKPVSFGFLLYLYTVAYQKMYEMEEICEQFGIWGHDIEDLVYNGNSTVEVYKDYIVASFSCDS